MCFVANKNEKKNQTKKEIENVGWKTKMQTKTDNKDRFVFLHGFCQTFLRFESNFIGSGKSNLFSTSIATVELESEQQPLWQRMAFATFCFSFRRQAIYYWLCVSRVLYRCACSRLRFRFGLVRFGLALSYAKRIPISYTILNWHGTFTVHFLCKIYKKKHNNKSYWLSLFCNLTIITVKCMIGHYFRSTST